MKAVYAARKDGSASYGMQQNYESDETKAYRNKPTIGKRIGRTWEVRSGSQREKHNEHDGPEQNNVHRTV